MPRHAKQLKSTDKALYFKVDGVPYRILVTEFTKGSSVFIPCHRIQRGIDVGKDVGRRLGIEVEVHPVIENGLLGVRVFRI